MGSGKKRNRKWSNIWKSYIKGSSWHRTSWVKALSVRHSSSPRSKMPSWCEDNLHIAQRSCKPWNILKWLPDASSMVLGYVEDREKPSNIGAMQWLREAICCPAFPSNIWKHQPSCHLRWCKAASDTEGSGQSTPRFPPCHTRMIPDTETAITVFSPPKNL